MTWQEQGRCAGQNPLWWDSDWLVENSPGRNEDERRAHAVKVARRLCDGCPVWTECRDDAAGRIDLSEPFNRCAEVHNFDNERREHFRFVDFEQTEYGDVSGVVRAGYLL